MPQNPQRIPPASPPMRRIVTSYPTPVISDQILIEIVSTETGDYTPLPYGTLYNSVPHTAYAKGKDDYYLVYQSPVDNSGWAVQRVWANSRTDQDSYNYAITYLSDDPNYPQIVRTYVYLRSEYGLDKDPSVGPLPLLTPDSEYPGALLVTEQMAPDAGQELNSLYVRVTRVFQTLPGPITTTQDFDFELNTLVWTDRQIVLSDDILLPEYEPLLMAMQETPQNAVTKLRVKSYLQELPPSKVEFNTAKYPFPTLLYDIVYSQAQIAPSPDPFSASSPPSALTREEVIIIPSTRAAPSVPAKYRLTTTFWIGQPPEDQIYALLLKDCVANLLAAQLNYPNVLCDEITVSLAFTDDGRWGNLNSSVTFGATVPSATEYINTVAGTWRVAKVDTQRWRGQMYVKQVSEVLMV